MRIGEQLRSKRRGLAEAPVTVAAPARDYPAMRAELDDLSARWLKGEQLAAKGWKSAEQARKFEARFVEIIQRVDELYTILDAECPEQLAGYVFGVDLTKPDIQEGVQAA